MHKLKVNVEELQVESFEVNSSTRVGRGTVQGAANTRPSLTIVAPPDTTDDIYCISIDPCVPSNEATCDAATCGHTCYPTCYC